MPIDPMAEALASLGAAVPPPARLSPLRPRSDSPTPPLEAGTPQPFRTKSGVIKFQPDSSDWSLSRLGEVEAEFQKRTGKALPVSVRGQGRIHNRWKYAHQDSADISVNPLSSDGRVLGEILRQKQYPYLAFEQAIPGVATGPHHHLGRPSKRMGQRASNSALTQSTADPMAEALAALKPVQRSDTQPSPRVLSRWGAPRRQPVAAVRGNRGLFADVTGGVQGVAPPLLRRPTIKVPDINQILTEARTETPTTFAEDRAQRTAGVNRERQARGELRQRVKSAGVDEGEYKNFLVQNRLSTDSPAMREAFIDFKVKQRMAAGPNYRQTEKASGYGDLLNEPGLADLGQRAIETEIAETQRKARVAQIGVGEKLTHIPKSLVGSFYTSAGEGIKGLAVLSKKAARAGLLGPHASVAVGEGDAKDSAAYQLGETIIRDSREMVGINPDLEKELLYGKAPAVIGQVTTMLLGGAVTKAPRIAAMLMGGTMNASSAYDEVLASGGNEDQAVNGGLWAAGLLTPTELLGMHGIQQAVAGTAKAATIRAALKESLKTGRRDIVENALEGLVQEAGMGAITGNPRTAKELLESAALEALGGTASVPLSLAAKLPTGRKDLRRAEVTPLGENVAPDATAQGALESSREFYHRNWGNVIVSPDQSGARRGTTKVYEAGNPDRVHYPQTTDLSGRGNNLMVPVRPRTEGPAQEESADPMAEALAALTPEIHRSQEPDAGPKEFRGVTDDVLFDLATEQPIPKGTSRAKRQQIAEQRVAAQAEIERRQGEVPVEIIPPAAGVRVSDDEVPSFQDYVENRPEGGTRFETLEPGSPDFNQLANEYTARYAIPETRAERKLKSQQGGSPSLQSPGSGQPEGGSSSRAAGAPLDAHSADSKIVGGPTTRATSPEGKGVAQTSETFRDNPQESVDQERATEKPVDRNTSAPPVETVSVGRESKAVTERGSEVATRYAIIDLDNLITSHDSTLNLNPKFPQELQPRERDRAASAEQISRIASQLRPEFLGESPKASEGAPIVGRDGIVESGNGRVLGIRQAYEANNRGSQAYKRFLVENAERFGVDPNAIKDKSRPVLVRVRTSEIDRPQFVKEANEQSIASMSSVEQARSDAKMLKGPLLDLFRPSESGDVNTASNLNFIKAFMRDVVGANELGRYVTASGQVSQEGIARIRNAVFSRAFGESPEGLIALEKLAESPDNNVRNLTTAMLRNAAGFASLREGIDQGTRYPLDLAPDVAKAMGKISTIREQGMLVADYLNQGALYGEDLSPIQKRLLQVFDENKRGANTIDAILKNYVRGAEAAGDPNQQGMFGAEALSKADILEAAILEAIDVHANLSPNLFAAPNQGVQPRSQTRGTRKEADTRRGAPINPPADTPTYAPRVTETEISASEGEGRTLKPFDSAIDRLKTAEEEARQRLTQRGAEFQKLLDERRGERGATTIPQDLYDYVVIGASKLAQRSLNVAQFVDEMVREFGEAIRKHAREIFKLSRNMVRETQKGLRDERLSKEIANRLFVDNVPKEQQREALRIAARFRTSTDTQGKFLSGFKSRVGEMAKSYGAAGGELTNRVHLGDIARGHEMEAGNKYLTKIQDVYSKIKNDFERQRISDAVINALENRSDAEKYLDTPQKKEVFEQTKAMLDEFRQKLTALGYETREDYFTHIRDVDILDQIISDAKDPKEVSLDDLVGAKSRFLQTRLDAKIEIKKDLPRVLFSYLKSITKEIAYSDAVEYYYNQFPTDIPISLRKNSMDRAISLMQNSLKPEQGRGMFYRTVGRLRSEQYRNFLAYNLKASAQNFTQVEFAKLRWTPEARSLVGKMWRNRKALTGPLADAIDLASTKETPLMRFLEQFAGDDPRGTTGRFSELFNKYDPFQGSEHRNWALSELGSIINSAVKHPEYKALKADLGAEGAINKLLENQNVFDKAVREAATTAAETQVAGNPAMRAEFYDEPLHRIIGMFTAFKTRQIQILSEALRSHEGINGARAQTILRRGLTGDAQPVEVLREIEAQRRAMEKMVERARKFREDVGIPLRSLGAMVEHLKGQEKELNGILKQLEPLSGSRAHSVALTAKYFAKVAAISVFFNLFWNSIYDAIAPPEKEKDAEERVSVALQKAFWEVLPSPFYGADPSKFLVSPVAPNFERSSAFGNVTKRGVTKDVVSYGSSVIPFAGVIDRATNRRLSGAVVDLLAPKKEKEQKIKF